MIATKTLLSLVLVCGAVVLIWGFTRKSSPPEIPFTKVTRGTVVSALSTNGKVEPIQWASARAERQGVVEKVFVQKGQYIQEGQELIELDMSSASSQLATAESEIAAAKAQQQTIRQGGPQLERTQIANDLAAARSALENAQHDYDALERLVAKQAATKLELELAREKVETAQLQIQALEKRRAALVTPADASVAQAKINEAEAAAAVARRNLALSVVRSPMDGTVYQFELRVGSFVNVGDLVANVGRLDQVRVTLYVDEPDLGKVERGMPVTITWTAMPGRQWKGEVDKLPTEVVPLGTRQVGEVGCLIANPDRDLLPGTNVDAEIQSRVVPNSVTIPKEALHREGDANGIYLLAADNKIVWRPVKLGVSSYTKAQVLQGLSVGDSIALPTDRTLKDGMRVQPVYP